MVSLSITSELLNAFPTQSESLKSDYQLLLCTDSTQLSPSSKANSYSSSQDIPSILCNSKFLYCVQKKSLSFVLMYPYHNLPPCFLNSHFNVNFSSVSRPSKSSLSSRFSGQSFVQISLIPMHATYSAKVIVILLIFCNDYKLQSSTLCTFP